MSKLTIEELQQARDYGIIDTASIRVQIEEMERQKYLEMHPYDVFECGGNWFTYLPSEEGKRKQVKRKKKEDIEKLICDFYRDKVENPFIEEVFNDWNRACLECGDFRASTFDRNEDFFKRHFSEMGKRRIKSVTVREWAIFLKEQVHLHHLKRKAYTGLHQVTFSLLKDAKIKGFIDFRISEIDEYISFGKKTFENNDEDVLDTIDDASEVFNTVETEKMLTHLVNHLDKQNLGILLMFLTGMRVGEIAALKRIFVKENGVIMIRHSETRYRDRETKKTIYEVGKVKTKAGKRDIVLPEGCEWVCNALLALNPNGEFVFENNGKRMTTNCFRRRQERLCKMLGIQAKSCHKARKTYASMLLDANLDNNLIIKQMGHTDVSMTEDKYHRDRKEVATKAKKLGTIREFNLVKNAG